MVSFFSRNLQSVLWKNQLYITFMKGEINMKLVPYDAKKITGGKSDNYSLINEFIDSGWECAKIEDYSQKDANSCATALNSSIKRYKRFTIKAVVRKGDVYLIRISKDK